VSEIVLEIMVIVTSGVLLKIEEMRNEAPKVPSSERRRLPPTHSRHISAPQSEALKYT